MSKINEIIEERINKIEGLKDYEREYLKWLKIDNRSHQEGIMIQ